MVEYGKTKKKYVFYDEDNLHAKLIVKLMEDGLKHGILFREFLKAYADDDPNIRNWVESNPQMKISKRSMVKRILQQKKIELEKTNFNLEQKEVDEIFDILSDEFGD
jgi:hypothetical protein